MSKKVTLLNQGSPFSNEAAIHRSPGNKDIYNLPNLKSFKSDKNDKEQRSTRAADHKDNKLNNSHATLACDLGSGIQ